MPTIIPKNTENIIDCVKLYILGKCFCLYRSKIENIIGADIIVEIADIAVLISNIDDSFLHKKDAAKQRIMYTAE